MTTIKMMFTVAILLTGLVPAFAGSGQNGPIGPGSRYGLEPGPDDLPTGISRYDGHAEVRPGGGHVAHPSYMHRRNHTR